MDDIEDFKRKIAAVARNAETARQLVAALQQTDWDAYFLEQEQQRQRAIATFHIETSPCGRCGKPCFSVELRRCEEFAEDYPGKYCAQCRQLILQEWYVAPAPCPRCFQLCSRALMRAANVPALFERYCPACVKEIEEAYRRVCCRCGAVFTAPANGDYIELCKSCRTKKTMREHRRVREHNQRAAELGLEATLSLPQWLATLDAFNWKCAYCQENFDDMEHFLTLSRGGGTTAGNCVPACEQCNARKSNRLPDALDDLFAAPNLAKIRAWLERCRAA